MAKLSQTFTTNPTIPPISKIIISKNCIKSILYIPTRRISTIVTNKNFAQIYQEEIHVILHQGAYAVTLINKAFKLAEKITLKELWPPPLKKSNEQPFTESFTEISKNLEQLKNNDRLKTH